ncbi:MAG: hypothetical protein ACQKBT_03700, partial [Puniceicoccales bacterium]
RHGDPSRPWNRFVIQTKDKEGHDIVGFQGNWRDIFQNWEALAWSFPLYNEAFIRKFLNASTADGYNPYRITAEGVDWEESDPNDPWSSIGYWGDHQIIYLLKLLEFAENLEPAGLPAKLGESGFVFADVPYEIKSFEELARDPNHSIHFNEDNHQMLLSRAASEGADGRLLHDSGGNLIEATLLEKLLIPLLVKLSNFVPDGGIWMNTQRPEWNDANNALAGHGLSVVTAGYLHRYLKFLDRLLSASEEIIVLHESLLEFIHELNRIFQIPASEAGHSAKTRFARVEELGLAGERYRNRVYRKDLGAQIPAKTTDVKELILRAADHLRFTLASNRRQDGLYHSYNVLGIDPETRTARVDTLGPMLEGQVSILSSEAISETDALGVIESLRQSPLYCPRRNSYILYADKELPSFLQSNCIARTEAESIPLLRSMLATQDTRLIEPSADGCVRFQADLHNRFALGETLDQIASEESDPAVVQSDRAAILGLYESTFLHRSFTGRSGSMFAYEGLGSIYWHMVSKLMLAVQECALKTSDPDRFKAFTHHYYEIQNGLGFRKTPREYGAFPADAYSHTPAHAGAQQPGLTGMVKEGILCRFAELGVEFDHGRLRFNPRLLRAAELSSQPARHSLLISQGQTLEIDLPTEALLFTLAQTPIVYQRAPIGEPSIEVHLATGEILQLDSNTLDANLSQAILQRTGQIRFLHLRLPAVHFIS